MGDPLTGIEACIDFGALARTLDELFPRESSAKGGRPAYPTETMVRILVLKRLNNLSDERMEFLLLDLLSYQRFCGLKQAGTESPGPDDDLDLRKPDWRRRCQSVVLP